MQELQIYLYNCIEASSIIKTSWCYTLTKQLDCNIHIDNNKDNKVLVLFKKNFQILTKIIQRIAARYVLN